ncbi:MAG: hypothetical protein KDI71_09010 [Xanthomonadales bacterium]|nr:hypothetical protein [Xanthomonadales bacterium]
MSMILHLEHSARSARVALHGLPLERPRQKTQNATAVGPVSTWRVVTGARKSDPSIGYDDLLEGDPEIDLALAGTEVDSDSATPAWFDPSAAEPRPIGDFADVDIVYDATGAEKTRRPHLVRRPNLNELHPVKVGKRLPIADALTAFAFKQTLQVAHTDGLTFEFLHDLAKDLADKGEVALLGAGPKGNLPLVLREHGTAYRAFLYGEVAEGRYKLLLLLSDQELKLPETAGEDT